MKITKKTEASWKSLIIIGLSISIFNLISIIIISQPEPPKPPTYEYEIRLIELNNSNEFLTGVDVVNYICDENVDVSEHDNTFYVSTWIKKSLYDLLYLDLEPEENLGRCMIKIRTEVNT